MSESTLSRYGVRLLRADFPRDYPLAATASLSAAYEEGFPVISRLYRRNYFRGGQFPMSLPDKEFRYLRTVIVTAAVYRGLASKLRPKANLSA